MTGFKPAEEGTVLIQEESDLVAVRKTLRGAAADLGFSVTDVTRIVTAASELTRNVYLYAGSGVMRWRVINAEGNLGLELTFEDDGPGIPNVEEALTAGYSTSGGLGMGLPGARRLMDETEIDSAKGRGTTVTVRRWLNR